MQKGNKKYKIWCIEKRDRKMDFNNKKVRKIVAIVIMVVIVAMIATTIIPAMMV